MVPDWVVWASFVLAFLGTGGVGVLVYQWYIDNHKAWPFRVSIIRAVMGSLDGRSGAIAFVVENPTRKNAYFTVWAQLSDGSRMFPSRVDLSPMGQADSLIATLPPGETGMITAMFNGVREGLDVSRGVITEGGHPRREESGSVSLYLDDVREAAGVGDEPYDPQEPTEGLHYSRDLRIAPDNPRH